MKCFHISAIDFMIEMDPVQNITKMPDGYPIPTGLLIISQFAERNMMSIIVCDHSNTAQTAFCLHHLRYILDFSHLFCIPFELL